MIDARKPPSSLFDDAAEVLDRARPRRATKPRRRLPEQCFGNPEICGENFAVTHPAKSVIELRPIDRALLARPDDGKIENLPQLDASAPIAEVLKLIVDDNVSNASCWVR